VSEIYTKLNMLTELPTVSIVTSVFNQARFLESSMVSVFTQTYPNIEYIVTDGGSTDGSTEIVRKHEAKLAYWHSRPDSGPSDGISQGFRRASGKILAWLNADDLLAEDAVENAVAAFKRHPNAHMVYGNRVVVDDNGILLYYRPSLPILAQTPYIATILPQETCFFLRSAYEACGGLDPAMKFAFDYDLFSKIARHGPIIYSGDIWGFFRKHNMSLTMLQTSTTGRQDVCTVQDRVWGRRCGKIEWALVHLLVKTYALGATPFARIHHWSASLPPLRRKGLPSRVYASLHETNRVKIWTKNFFELRK
jgi:glycosyltransferase involved in cell wall biosynthesis